MVLGSLAGVAAKTVMTLSKNKGDLQVEISEEVNIQINSMRLNIFGNQLFWAAATISSVAFSDCSVKSLRLIT